MPNDKTPAHHAPFAIHHSPKLLLLFAAAVLCIAAFGFSSCGVYSFRDVSIPDSVKSIRVVYIENRAPYVNPQLSPDLTERVRRKILNQTRLRVTNDENANWVINATITDYSVAASGVGGERNTSLSRLNIAVQVSITNNMNPGSAPQEFSINRTFDFDARLTLQQAENTLREEMLRGLSDDIFNRLFSNW